MPIVRRSIVNNVRMTPDMPFVAPGRPLYSIILEKSAKASDLAWEGDIVAANKIEAEIRILRSRVEAGELYEVDF